MGSARHKWMKGNFVATCERCGCWYFVNGVYSREYHQPDGRVTSTAGACAPETVSEGKS